ncbi:hypothetical protein BDF22DRAFT_742461 [Syncephalis plumigaleata]|nr:hypothetical protein BDF22DRAFT_742461 [Syncephalis plumigaleata]
MADEHTNLCASCHTAIAKYRCPRCETRTCSLSCVQTHKSQTGCSGKRDRTSYVPMKEFGINQLTSDIQFLEEGVEKKINAERMNTTRNGNDSNGSLHQHRHQHHHRAHLSRGERIAKWAFNRCQVTVHNLATGMQRQQENRTSWDGKQKHMLWTVQVAFGVNKDAQTVLLHRMADTLLLDDIIQNACKRLKSNQSTDTTSSSSSSSSASQTIAHILLRRIDSPANAPIYYDLLRDMPLYMALQAKTIIEYPTIIVAYNDHVIPEHWQLVACPYSIDKQQDEHMNTTCETNTENNEQCQTSTPLLDNNTTTTTTNDDDGDPCDENDKELVRTFEVQEPDSNDEGDSNTTIGMKDPEPELHDGNAAITCSLGNLHSLVAYSDTDEEEEEEQEEQEEQEEEEEEEAANTTEQSTSSDETTLWPPSKRQKTSVITS